MLSRELGIDLVGALVDDIGSALVGGESSDSSQSIGASVTHAAALNLSFNSSPEVQVNKIFQEPAAGEVSSQDRFGSQVVLVVDDNAINRKLLGRMLKHASVEYFNAENGQEAVDFMKRSKNYTQQPGAPQVGLILMDWSMPVMDGCQATRVIRELNLDVPIVALTACALEEGLQELHNAGASEIATKPIIRDDLIRICGRYLLGMANV
jgi:CheY-like chemotaxis protein